MTVPRSWGWSALALLALLSAACGGAETSAAAYAAPVAVVFDERLDRYLVLNASDGSIVQALPGAGAAGSIGAPREWLAAGLLHDPRGLALGEHELLVTEATVVRRFDRRSGAALGSYDVPGASDLCGVAVASDGQVFVADRGVDTIWRIGADGAVVELLRDEALAGPTGVVVRKAGVYVVSGRDGSFHEVDFKGRRTPLGEAPQAELRGLVRVELGAESGGTVPVWFATSAAGSTIYRFTMTGGAAALPVRLEQPGMPCWDAGRHRIVVPLRDAGELHVQRL